MRKSLPEAKPIPASFNFSFSLAVLYWVGEGLLDDFCRTAVGSREKGREGKGGQAKGSPSPERTQKPRAPYLCGYGHSALLRLPQEDSPANAPQDVTSFNIPVDTAG